MGSIALQPASLVNTANSGMTYAATYPNSVPFAPNKYWTIAPNLLPQIPGNGGLLSTDHSLYLGFSNASNYGLASGVTTLAAGNPTVTLASGLGGYTAGGVGTLGMPGPNKDGVGSLS